MEFQITRGLVIALALAWAAGCGGAEEEPRVPAEASDDDVPRPYDDDPDRSGEGAAEGEVAADGDATAAEGDAEDDGETGEGEPEVIFALDNTHPDRDLVFSLDRGWQPVIFAFSGEPPDAESILMFPKHCTAACDADPADRCPTCPEPTDFREIREAQERESVPPGETLEVVWDQEVFLYEDGEGTRDGQSVTCECYDKERVSEDTYTVRACGFRVSDRPNEASVYQCEDATMEVPVEETLRVEFDFGVEDDPTAVGG